MKVAVLGAGAIGLPLGYMLRNGEKNEVTYLVRKKKVEMMQSKTYKFFSYDKKEIIVYQNVKCLPTERLVKSLKKGRKNRFADFDLLISTLPTDLLASEKGQAMFRGLGQRLKPECVILSLSPGFQMQEKVFTPAGIDKNRVFYGLPNFLSHEVSKSHELENEKFPLMKEADIAFHFLMNSTRILMVGRKPKAFVQSMKAAKKKSLGLGETTLELASAMFIILNLELALQEFPKGLKKKVPSFTTAVQAFGQISKHYGKMGTLMRLTVGKNMFKLVDKSNRWQSKPLTVEFLKYHHGQKVFQQNFEVIEAYIGAGEERGLKTDKIKEFVNYCKDFADAKAKGIVI